MKKDSRDERFIGQVVSQRNKKDLLVISLVSQRPNEIVVNPRSTQAQVGDLVAGRIVTSMGRGQRGSIERIFRAASVTDLAIAVSLELEEVPQQWPKSLGSLSIPRDVDAQTSRTRIDLCKVPLVTIDGSDARDFDDAVFCEPQRDGWRLVVAIADVAHYVEVGSDLDREAHLRGTSVYLPDKVIPMLPTELSNGICSLNPQQDRLAVVCDMKLNAAGDVTTSTFYEAVMQSHARLTYREVADFLRNGRLPHHSLAVRASLIAFHDSFTVMAKSARNRGSLDFNTNETILDIQNGVPTRVVPVERNNAHRMIELAMIAANVQAAEFLERHEVTPLYRVHEPPDGFKLKLTAIQLRQRGVAMPNQITAPAQLQRVLDEVRRLCKPSEVWEVVLLSAMAQAHYAPNKIGHFGLALTSYAHFTSPIRRYPDLMVHRLIKHVLGTSQTPPLTVEKLEEYGAKLSACERRAISVERRVEGWLKASLLESKLGIVFDGTVASVRAFGLFVELDAYFVSGLVHVSNLSNDYYEFFGGELRGQRSGRVFRLGDRVRVRLAGVQAPLGRIDLELV